MMMIAKNKMKSLTAEKVDLAYADRAELIVHCPIAETLVDILQLHNSSASNGIKTESVWFLETYLIE